MVAILLRVLVLALAFGLSGCGGAAAPAEPPELAALGSRCTKSADCASSNCNLSGDFPGGLCTKACSASADCPAGFVCVSNSSGICMESCGQDSDCAAYGTAWGCREQSLEDGKEDEDRGKRFVCSKR